MGQFTDSQLLALTADPEFQELIRTDAELDRLCSIPRRTPDALLAELGLALGGSAAVGEIYLPAPTAGTLLILGALQSPYLRGAPRRLIDVDAAVYVLGTGREALNEVALSVDGIEGAAAGLCDGMDRAEADGVIVGLLAAAFAAVDLLPEARQGHGRPCLFDLPWFAWLTSTVAGATGHTAEYVGWRMPLTLAMHYVVVDRRRQGAQVIDQTPKELIMARVNAMCAEHCKRKGYA